MELVFGDVEQYRVHVLTERVLAGDGEGLDAGEALVVQERDERLAARVAVQDLMGGRAAHPVLSAVDEPAMKDEVLVVKFGVVLEFRDAGVPARIVEFADDGFICGVDEVLGMQILFVYEALALAHDVIECWKRHLLVCCKRRLQF